MPSVKLASQSLNVGIGSGGIRPSSISGSQYSGTRTAPQVNPNAALVNYTAMPVPQVIQDKTGVAALNMVQVWANSAFKYQERKDQAVADRAVLEYSDQLRDSYYGTVGSDGKVQKGLKDLVGQESLDSSESYTSGIDSSMKSILDNLSPSQAEKAMLRMNGARNTALNRNASHQVKQMEVVEQNLRNEEYQTTLQSIENNVAEAYASGLVERTVAKYDTLQEQQAVRAGLAEFSLIETYNNHLTVNENDYVGAYKATEVVAKRVLPTLSEVGEQKLTTWMLNQKEASTQKADRDSNKTRDLARNKGLSEISSKLTESYTSFSGAVIAASLLQVDLMNVGEPNSYDKSVVDKNRIVSNFLSKQMMSKGATPESVNSHWNQKVIEAQEAGTPFNQEVLRHANTLVVGMRKNETQKELIQQSNQLEGSLGFVGKWPDITNVLMGMGLSPERAEMLQKININSSVIPSAEVRQTQLAYKSAHIMFAKKGAYPKGSEERNSLYELAALNKLTSTDLQDILKINDESGSRPKVSEDIKDANKEIEFYGTSGMLTGDIKYTVDAIKEADPEDKIEMVEENAIIDSAISEVQDALRVWKSNNPDTPSSVFTKKYFEEHKKQEFDRRFWQSNIVPEDVLPNVQVAEIPVPDPNKARTRAMPNHVKMYEGLNNEDKAIYTKLKMQDPNLLKSIPPENLPAVLDVLRKQGVM